MSRYPMITWLGTSRDAIMVTIHICLTSLIVFKHIHTVDLETLCCNINMMHLSVCIYNPVKIQSVKTGLKLKVYSKISLVTHSSYYYRTVSKIDIPFVMFSSFRQLSMNSSKDMTPSLFKSIFWNTIST